MAYIFIILTFVRILLIFSMPNAIVFVLLQRACYLSINPLKEESMEAEKSQYTLPDGSTVEVCLAN